MKARLAYNAAALWVAQVVNYIAPFLVLIHLTKTLGVEKFGILAFSQGVVALCLVIVDFGYSLSATAKISTNRENKEYVGRLIGGVVAVKLILYIVCCCLVLAYALLTEKYSDYWSLFVLSLLPLATQGFLPIWVFHGIEKMHIAAFAIIASKSIFAILVMTFVAEPLDYIFVPLLGAAGDIVSILICVFFIHNLKYRIAIPSLRWVKYCYMISIRFFVSRIAVASYTSGGIIVLGLFAQPVIVAVYSMAEQLYKAMQAALGPFAAAAYPYMTKEKNAPLMIKLILGVVIFTCLGSLIGYLIAPKLLIVLFDESWVASISVLNVFFVAIIVHAAAIMTGYPLAAVVVRLDVANSSVVTGALVYFSSLLIIFLLDLVTPDFLAMVMLISELSVFLHRAFVLVPLAMKNNPLINFKEGKP